MIESEKRKEGDVHIVPSRFEPTSSFIVDNITGHSQVEQKKNTSYKKPYNYFNEGEKRYAINES